MERICTSFTHSGTTQRLSTNPIYTAQYIAPLFLSIIRADEGVQLDSLVTSLLNNGMNQHFENSKDTANGLDIHRECN